MVTCYINITLGKLKDHQFCVFCPYVDERHQCCSSRPWQPSELRMALEGEVLDMYIDSLVNYINSSALQNKNSISNNINNNNTNNNNNNINITPHLSHITSSSSAIANASLPVAVDDSKPLNPSIIQDLLEALNITCPQCNAVLDPTPDGCCSVRYMIVVVLVMIMVIMV